MLNPETIDQWDRKTGAALKRIEVCAQLAQHYTGYIAEAVDRLSYHPDWDSRAADELSKARIAMTEALGQLIVAEATLREKRDGNRFEAAERVDADGGKKA